MDTHFNYVHVAASETLEDFTIEKLSKLKKHYDFIISADVYFKTGKSSDPNKAKICEIRLNVPGDDIFASSTQENFEKCIYDNVSILKLQLQKRKEKMKTHM